MKRFVLLITFSLILSSCGGSGRGLASLSDGSAQIGQTIQAGGSLSDSEISLATDMCYAFKGKRSEFNNTLHGTQHKIKREDIDCDDSKSSENIDVKISGSNESLKFETLANANTLRISKILSDISPGMREICEAIFTGERPQKVNQEGGDLLIRSSFFRTGGESYVRLEYANRSFTNSGEVIYTITNSEDYQVQLGDKFNDLPEGTVKVSTYFGLCSDDPNAETFEVEQTLSP